MGFFSSVELFHDMYELSVSVSFVHVLYHVVFRGSCTLLTTGQERPTNCACDIIYDPWKLETSDTVITIIKKD